MRLFIAATFPHEVLRDLSDRIAALKSRLPPASWVRTESQHLTFAFLGEQDESLIEEIAEPLTGTLAKISAFEARLRGCGFFPNARRARVGWAGLEPEARFKEIAIAVREIVTSSGVVLDRTDFRPHLTLMRIREPWPPASTELFSRQLRGYESQPFTLDTVTLFSSKLDPRGAVHTPQRTFALRS